MSILGAIARVARKWNERPRIAIACHPILHFHYSKSFVTGFSACTVGRVLYTGTMGSIVVAQWWRHAA